MKLFALLVLVVTISLTIAVPQRRRGGTRERSSDDGSRSQCASRCTGVKNKFNFLTGQSYIYNFDSTSKVRIIGSQVPENPLRQTATVTISVIQPCEFSLKLSNVQIQGHNDRSWQEELESRPLRFSFDDGIIGEICPHSQEPAWALNIKRAILSTFQNALEGSTRNREVYETDVSGKCPAKYEISKDRRSEKTILKKKDLIRCLNHRGNYTGIKGVQYNIKSKLQNAPLIDSNQECKHVISRRILKEAICTETHSFQPFRNQKGENSAIVAEVSQKLQFVNNRKDTVQTSVGPKKSLTFDHSEFEFEESAQSKSQVVNNIRELCRISSSDVRPETPGLFTELVYGLRKLGFSELRSVYQDVQKNRICAQDKKLFLDAIPACGSESCVKLMVTILKAGSLSSSETVQWVTSLVFIPKPTLNMVKDVSQLVGTIQPKALLGLSSLVHGYCRVNPSCAEVPEVRQIMTQLRNKLGNKCSKIRNQESTGIFVLKAIGNIGHVESAVPVLINCLDSRNSIEIRLEAIQALRRMPCGVGQQKDTLMQLFRDNSEDIEIRLVSFMTLMKCPTAELISEVKNVLDSETITQVGSFVWSYLKEKSSSSDPFQRKLYQMLHQHSFSSKFNRDPRKFSRFYEFGKFMEQLNMGAHADSAVIMEPHGYLPRQGFFNFTVHLFGSSINLFEIGGRTEGLERLKEKLFGPDGYFSNPAGYYFGETDRKDHSSSRVKSFQDLFSRRRTFSDEFSMSMYLKIFGDDLMYYDFKNANMLDEIKNMANTEKLIQYLAEQRNFKISKNMLFLDSTLTIPTISGLPLRLAVNGTASVNVEYGGKMDFTQLAQPPHNRIEILGEIKPSAAIELSSSLALHVRDMKTGMKMVGRLHTSTAAKGSISLRDGEFKAKLELPDDQMEIIDIQSEALHIAGNRHIIEPGTRGQKFQAQSCSSSNFNRIFGLKICGMLTYNKGVSRVPYFPLSGPMRTKITVEKSDPSLRSYELTTKFRNTQAESLLEFGVDTPGSTVDREVKAKIQYKPGSSSAPTSVKVNLKAPEKEYNIEGELTRNNNIDEGQLSLTVDNRNRYAVSAKLQKTVQRGRRVHNLEAEVAIPGQEAVKLTGNLQSQSKRYSIDFNLEGVYSQPIEGRAKWEQPETQNKKFNSELMFKCPALHFDLKAFGEADPSGSLQYQYTMEYKRPRIDLTPHKITASQKQVIQRRGDTIKLISTSTFDSSWYPDWNSVTKYTMVKSSDLFENRLNIQYGATKKTADFVQVTRITEGDKYTTNLDLKIPESRLNEKMKIIYQNRFPDSFLAKLLWPTFKDFKGELRLENSNNRLWQFEAEAKAKYTGREMRLYKEIKELSPQTYQSEAILQWQRNKQIEINTNLKIKSARGSYGYEMSGDAKMSGQPDVIRFSKRFQMSRDETKYMAWTKVGDRSLYDLKLDTIKESQTKTNFHAHLKSQYLDNTDYAVSGYVDDSARTTKYVATVKKAQRDWMKGEVILPKKVANSPEVRAKGHLFWDMHTRDVKEIMADYKLTKDGRERQHDLQTKIKSGRADYLWNVKIVKGDYYVMNSTIIKNNKPIMETNWGSKVVGEIINPSQLAIDFKFRTHPPMRLHHVTGLLVYNNAGDEQMTASVFVQNHQNNKKAGIKMGTKFENVGRGTRGSYQLSLILNDKELSTSTVVNMPNSERFLVLNGNSKTKLAWAKNKEITLDEEFQLDISRTSFYKSTWKTPFRQLSELKSELRLETPTNPPKFSFLYEWNKNKRISGHLTGTVDESAVDLNLNLETSFRTLKKLEGKLKYNFRPQIWDIETWLKWNNQGRIKFIHQIRDQSGKYTVKLGAWCEIPGTVNLIANSDFEFDSSQRKYLADCSLNFDGQNYKLKADVNLDNKNGEIQIETPYENWRSASLEVSKSNNNQYLIETKRNGAKTGSVTALVKMETNDHQVKFEVDDVRHPFNLIYEGTYTRRKWNFRAEVNRNPNNPSTKQTYGIQLTDESKGESEAEGRMVIRHPSRQVELKISRDESVANTFKVTAEFQYDTLLNVHLHIE